MPKLTEVKLSTEIRKAQLRIDALRCIEVEQGTAWREGDGRMLAHLADFIVGQLECCIKRSQDLSMMELASATRNLFELTFVSDYLSQGVETRLRFAEECRADTIYIRTHLGKSDNALDQNIESASHEFVSSARSAQSPAAKHPGTLNSGSRPTRKIADELGRKANFEKYNRFYSKLCHPTPWAIFGASDGPICWERYAVHLLYRANIHAADCVEFLFAGLVRQNANVRPK